jgi:heme O synthase-like polyprenyltransferase
MRLSGLVILTTMVGYAVAPGVVSPDALLWTSVGVCGAWASGAGEVWRRVLMTDARNVAGTGMCVSSANCINQWCVRLALCMISAAHRGHSAH